MTSAKYEVEKFDGRTSFNMLKIKMKSFLILKDLWRAIKERFFKGMRESNKVDM